MPTPDTVKVEITAFGYENHAPGAKVDVDPATAKALVTSGHAVPANKTAEKAIPAAPSVQK